MINFSNCKIFSSHLTWVLEPPDWRLNGNSLMGLSPSSSAKEKETTTKRERKVQGWISNLGVGRLYCRKLYADKLPNRHLFFFINGKKKKTIYEPTLKKDACFFALVLSGSNLAETGQILGSLAYYYWSISAWFYQELGCTVFTEIKYVVKRVPFFGLLLMAEAKRAKDEPTVILDEGNKI